MEPLFSGSITSEIGLEGTQQAWKYSGWSDGAAAAAVHRLLIQGGGAGLSPAVKALYTVASVVLVAVSGLMAGLVLGLLSLDRMDLEVLKRSGDSRKRWLVERVEPFTRNPHFTMCSLVVVNAACNTALPLFIDRLLNPLAAILISVTAILLFAEIAPQAVCKRYGLEIGAYCSWLVRGLMVVTSPVSWPLGKALDWLLGEESALFRRQELNALISLHAEPQQDGSVGALTRDEAQVIQGALELAGKTAEAVMTPLGKVFMLSSEAVIDVALLDRVLSAGHSRVPVFEGDNRQAIMGLILVKELLLVDEQAGVRVKELRLREMPFLRADIPLYDVLKIFRVGRKHMACLTRVAAPDPSSHGAAGGGTDGTGGAGGTAPMRRPSPALPTLVAGQAVEEAVGIATIEDVLEELLQAEIVDETDRYEDNLQTVKATPQVSMKELPPHLRRFLSPRRSMQGFTLSAARGAAAEVARLTPDGRHSPSAPTADGQQLGDQEAGVGPPAGDRRTPLPAELAGPASTASSALQRQSSGASRRSLSHASLVAAAAANAMQVLSNPPKSGAEGVAAAMAAGVRAAELNAVAAGQQMQQGSRPSSRQSFAPHHPDQPAATDPQQPRESRLSGGGRPPLPLPARRSGSQPHVALEMGDCYVRKTSSDEAYEGREAEEQHVPLVRRSLRQLGRGG